MFGKYVCNACKWPMLSDGVSFLQYSYPYSAFGTIEWSRINAKKCVIIHAIMRCSKTKQKWRKDACKNKTLKISKNVNKFFSSHNRKCAINCIVYSFNFHQIVKAWLYACGLCHRRPGKVNFNCLFISIFGLLHCKSVSAKRDTIKSKKSTEKKNGVQSKSNLHTLTAHRNKSDKQFYFL